MSLNPLAGGKSGRLCYQWARPHSNRAEAAEWWDAHPEVIEDILERGRLAGTLGRGTDAAKLKTRPTTIRLFVDDVETAKTIAHRKGLSYQTYIKMLLHEALRREAKAG